MYDFDLLVIGGGSGGVRCARIAAGLGARVAIVEDTHWGGTCVNVGCIPKKIYHYLASCVDEVNMAKALGFNASLGTLDWNTFFYNKEKEIQRLQGVYRNLLENSGATIIDGLGSLIDGHTVKVGETSYSAEHVLLAVGGQPAKADFTGAEHTINSDQLFTLSTIPKRMLVVGGGYIGCELASTFHKLGVHVELSVRSKILKEFDQEMVAFLEAELVHEGLTIHKGSVIDSITLGDANLKHVTFSDNTTGDYDCVLMAMGRTPRYEGLGLNNTQVRFTRKELIEVNDHYQTTEPSIFAVGDIITGPDLTPVALTQGMYLAHHLFGKTEYPIPDLSRVATTVFTHPQLATVGLSEEQVIAKGVKAKVFTSQFRLLKTRITDYKLSVLVKMIVDSNTDEILGIHMAGPEVGEAMQGFAACVQARMTKAQLDQTVGIHPTFAEELVTMRQATREI